MPTPVRSTADTERPVHVRHGDPFAVQVLAAASSPLLGTLKLQHAAGLWAGTVAMGAGDKWNLGWMWGHPGKKLLFMGRPDGFEWISHADAQHSVLAFVRHGEPGSHPSLVVCNFTPVVHHGWRLGVPRAGRWAERLNTGSQHHGGSNVGQPLGAAQSQAIAAHGQPQSISITLPPLACVFYEWTD